MKKTLLISVLGDDKPGLVKQLSDAIKLHNGNWLESRLSHLGDKFAGLVLAEFDDIDVAAVKTSMGKLNSDQLNVQVEQTDHTPCDSVVRLSVVGNDKPGIIYELSNSLSQLNVNVELLNSEVEAAPMSGGELFKATLELSMPKGVTIVDLQNQLESVSNDLMVDLAFD